MLRLSETYKEGNITQDKEISIDKAVEVMVTFIDEDIIIDEPRLTSDDFSFEKSRELLKDVKNSFSDTVIEERRSGF